MILKSLGAKLKKKRLTTYTHDAQASRLTDGSISPLSPPHLPVSRGIPGVGAALPTHPCALLFLFYTPVLVPVRASPVPSVVRGSLVVKFFFTRRVLF